MQFLFAEHGRGALPLALLLTWCIGASVLIAFPYRGYAIEPAPSVHTVYLCCLPAKDQSRHVNTGLLPVHGVQTISYRAADIAPQVHAAQNRKPQKQRRRSYAAASR